MKVSEYIVDFFIKKQIKHIFGYPGGMVTYLIDALQAREMEIASHVHYHEQAAALAACGYAQASRQLGLAYATSGPGATNLITGICNAYFDSLPVLFLTGQVNINEGKGKYAVRQKGFQETDIVSMVSGVTKYCVTVLDEQEIRYHLEKAYDLAFAGRPGPVLLDIPMNIQRSEVDPESLRAYVRGEVLDTVDYQAACADIVSAFCSAKRPCILAGAGIHSSGMQGDFASLVQQMKVPVVSSMPAVDLLPCSPYYYGFVGAYGMRLANFILAKSDLIVSLGSRMDTRQVGANPANFVREARLIRVDVDTAELSIPVKEKQECYACDLKDLLPLLLKGVQDTLPSYENWLQVCDEIRSQLAGIDVGEEQAMIKEISHLAPTHIPVTTDVGQNQVWVAQAFEPKGQRILFSAGHGTMGYSLPAAIGAHYATQESVLSFQGDGGIQMNLQELQFIARERLPIKIIVLNNRSLGMIRHFQEMYFASRYTQTKQGTGYEAPNFQALAAAYGLVYEKVSSAQEVKKLAPVLSNNEPAFIELCLNEDTYVYPKLAFGKPIHDQEPMLDREKYDYIMQL